MEFPGYGPAEGTPNESSVNDNVYTALDYLKVNYSFYKIDQFFIELL